MRRSDSLRPSPRASLLLRLAVPPRAPVFVTPLRPDAGLRPGALRTGNPHARCYRGGVYRVSQGSQGPLRDLCRVLRPRRDRTPLARAGRRRGPRADKAEGSPRVGISGLQSTASALAVYASPSPLRCRRRKTRFRWLARPCRVGLITHRVATKGFKDTTSSPPFLSLPGAMSETILILTRVKKIPDIAPRSLGKEEAMY